jgi:pimeloyl-ACP methyl ester carboxylesterase
VPVLVCAIKLPELIFVFKLLQQQKLTGSYFVNSIIMKEKSTSYQSSTIFYRVIGKGYPVILVHGFGEDGQVWNKQVDELSAGSGGKDQFQFIIPDLPGTNKSALIPDMSIEGMAETIKAVLQEENISACIVIGHSMGGYITLALAEKYPQLLSAFGLFSSSAFADTEEKKAARQKSIAFIQTNGAYEFFKTAIPGLFGAVFTKEHPGDIEELVERSKQFSAEAVIKYYEAMIARPDRTEVLKTFTGPVLFIIGEHDKAVPFDHSMQQCYLPAQSMVHILRNSAHMGMWEETDKANSALQEFLQQAT